MVQNHNNPLKEFLRFGGSSSGYRLRRPNSIVIIPTQQQQNQMASPPPLTPPNSPTLSTPQETPIMSALPSSVNLIAMDEHKSKRESLLEHGLHGLQKQFSYQPGPIPARVPSCEPKSLLMGLARLPALLLLLYFFICSLDFLSTAFRLIAGKTAGSVFSSNELLTNPIVGLMIGVLFTVLVQSSSTCTSVIVSMVSSGILDVRTAIPMVMGANIGTSLTSTLVSMTQLGDKGQFELAFAGATVHDCFNWLTVIILLVLESATGYLYNVSAWLTDGIGSNGGDSSVANGAKVNILGTLTKPFTKKIIQIDKNVLKCWGLGKCQDERLLKIWCKKPSVVNQTLDDVVADDGEKCSFLFNIEAMSDLTIGIILLVISLVLLSTCLILIVKLLRSLLQGAVADLIKKTINAEIPMVPWLTGYLAIIMGAILTFIVQSSSVFTSTLTPLVGVGLISLERVYPLTLGSNLGTTTTALLAAMAADGQEQLKDSLQIAFCHMLFNLTGILLFYPVPFMRWPLAMSKILGRTTAQYRWFALFYLVAMFFVLPAAVLGLSLLGTEVFLMVMIPIGLIMAFAIVVNVMQNTCPGWIPSILRNWDFLPLWMHSLDPLDRLFAKMPCCCCCSEYTAISTIESQANIDVINPV